MRRTSTLGLALLVLLTAGASGGVRASGSVPNPTVTEPASDAGLWGHPLWDSWYDLRDVGYEEAEYFVSGTATALDGRTADYTTRIIVSRPSDPDDFAGTVLLDWVNVTAQFENAVDTLTAHDFLVRRGWAFVHVSAQVAGICCTPLTPKVWDPVRYGVLSHPGDAYSFDIFSQVAKAIRAPNGVDPMDGLDVERLIAAGQSQSASRLSTYVRDVQPGADVIDGFLIHGGGSKIFAAPPAVPVLHLLSDAEASPVDPDATANYRLWEIAGSSHSDFWIYHHQEIGQGPRALAHAPKRPASADGELHAVAGNYGERYQQRSLTCIVGGSLFPTRYAVDAALHHLEAWIESGTPPPVGDRFHFDASGQLARDEHGNALGGIRLPPVEVPVASYVSTVCGLGGKTVPFTEPQLLLLYPTHASYVSAIRSTTAASVDAGFLLPEDAADLLARACAAAVRWPGAADAGCAAAASST